MSKTSFGSCVTPAADTAYLALQRAAERIGHEGYRAAKARGQRPSRKGAAIYQPSEAHRHVVRTMTAVCGGKITPEAAMAVLHEYDVTAARFPSKRRGK